MALTRIPSGPTSFAIVRVIDVIADFAAAYAPNIGLLFRIDIVATLIIEPLPLSRIAGSTARLIFNAEVQFISKLEYQESRSISSNVAKGGCPKALLTKTSTVPKALIVLATK